jgi:hypothetical protein
MTDASGPYGGTGLVAGPYPYTAAPGFSDTFPVPDPHITGVPSSSVQVQNVGPLPLIVTVGPDQYAVTASQSTTIPLPTNGAGIVCTLTNSGAATESGSLEFVWMLEGQWPPQPDGPLTSAAATGGSTGEVNYALETGGNLQQLEQKFYTYSNGGLQVVYYDSDSTITLATGTLIMGSVGSSPGTAVPGNSKVLQCDSVGRLVLSPASVSSNVNATIVSPLDGSGYVEVDVKLSVLPTNAAQETGGNLATIATPVADLGGQHMFVVNPRDTNDNAWAVITSGALNGGELGVQIDGGAGSLPPFAATPTFTLAAPSNASTISATSLQVKNAAGTLYGLTGFSATAQYVQLLDATALVSGTTVPKVSVLLPANGSFSLDYGDRGRAFGTGIYLAFSSTEAVFTTGAAGTLDAQYV